MNKTIFANCAVSADNTSCFATTLSSLSAQRATTRNDLRSLCQNDAIDTKAVGFAVIFSDAIGAFQSFGNLVELSRELRNSFSL